MCKGAAPGMRQAALSVPAAPVPTKAKSEGSSSEEDVPPPPVPPDPLCYHWEKNNPPAMPAPAGFVWFYDDREGWMARPTRPVERRPQ